MRALVLKRYGRPDQVAFVDTPRPAPRPDEILVQVHAAGLNPIDNMIPKGTFKPILRLQLPATLGSDLAGVVVEVGSRVTRFKPGQKVFIPAGAGGIGTFAIQFAKYLGAKAGTTTSTGNVDLVRSLGADEVIDYKKQQFEEVLQDYDAVLGTVP